MLPAKRRIQIDLAARIDRSVKRVERLETLEFSTTAFPAGGFPVICDIVLGAPAATVTLCPTAIPATFLHLYAIVELSSDVASPALPAKVEINVNADFGLVYSSYVRQEFPFAPGAPGSADTDIASPFGAGPTDTKWFGPRPGASSIFDALHPTAAFMLFPSYIRTDLLHSFAWFGFANPINVALIDGLSGNNFSGDQGGGGYFRAPTVPITTITFSAITGSFIPPSRFTLYGLP